MTEELVYRFDGKTPSYLLPFVRKVVAQAVISGDPPYPYRRKGRGKITILAPAAIIVMRLYHRDGKWEVRISCLERWFSAAALEHCAAIQKGERVRITVHPELQNRLSGRSRTWTRAARARIQALIEEFEFDRSKFMVKSLRKGVYCVRHPKHGVEGIVRVLRPSEICIEEAEFREHPGSGRTWMAAMRWLI